MNQLQLTYPARECVRCHRLSRGHERLCEQCRADDEMITRASARALKWASSAFRAELGYHLDQTEATTDWYDHGRAQ